MKKRQFILLIIALVVLGGLGLWVRWKQTREWSAGTQLGRKVFASLPLDKIAKVTIAAKDGTVAIQRKNDRWCVAQRYDYPANFDTLSRFLRDLADIKAIQVLQIGPSQYGRLHLLPPTTKKDKDKAGTDVTFFDKAGKPLATVRFGKEHQKPGEDQAGGGWPDGRYLLLPKSGKVVLVSKTFSSVQTDPKSWLNKDFFKIADMKTGKLLKNGKVVWEVARKKKTDDMKLLGLKKGEQQDDSKVRSISTAFTWASFDDVADPALTPEKTGLDHPTVFVATDFDGFQYTVKIGKKTKDDKYYLSVDVAYKGPRKRTPAKGEKPKDAKKKDEEFKKKLEKNLKKAQDLHDRLKSWVYIVSKYTVEDVLKSRKDLLKKPETKKKKAAKTSLKKKVNKTISKATKAVSAKIRAKSSNKGGKLLKKIEKAARKTKAKTTKLEQTLKKGVTPPPKVKLP